MLFFIQSGKAYALNCPCIFKAREIYRANASRSGENYTTLFAKRKRARGVRKSFKDLPKAGKRPQLVKESALFFDVSPSL